MDTQTTTQYEVPVFRDSSRARQFMDLKSLGAPVDYDSQIQHLVDDCYRIGFIGNGSRLGTDLTTGVSMNHISASEVDNLIKRYIKLRKISEVHTRDFPLSSEFDKCMHNLGIKIGLLDLDKAVRKETPFYG